MQVTEQEIHGKLLHGLVNIHRSNVVDVVPYGMDIKIVVFIIGENPSLLEMRMKIDDLSNK